MTQPTRWLMLSALLIPIFVAGCASESDQAPESYTEALEDYAADDLTEGEALDVASSAYSEAPSAPADQRLASQPAPAAASEPPPVPADLGRQLRRSAEIRLTADDYDAALGKARALAGRYGGMVAGEDGATYGETAETTLTLRVPSARFDAALDALAALGSVGSRQVTVDDVTSQVVDLEARLRAQRAAEARYVAFVGQAGSVSEMLEVQSRLDGVRAQIEVMESQARSLRGSVSLSTIRATVVGPAAVPAPPPGLWAAAGDAVVSGWRGFWSVVIGVLPLWPLAVVAGVALVVWRRLSPRMVVSP